MSKPTMERCPDYQIFSLDADGHVAAPGERMKSKLKAIPLPDLEGRQVLDIGCDFGFWSFLAANKGAARVLGLDRGRPVRGEYFDIVRSNREVAASYHALSKCFFEEVNIGKQWPDYGQFDVLFMFSLYHHIFENCGEHEPIWLWLRRQCDDNAVVLWENPTDLTDGVSDAHIKGEKRERYNLREILDGSAPYFTAEHIGPALHEQTRQVYRFKPRLSAHTTAGKVEAGAGGASKAFMHSEGRRSKEILDFLGFVPFPGSLNIRLSSPFDWTKGYYRTQILDVRDRSNGFDSSWEKRYCRFYPLTVNGVPAFAMRFDMERDYAANFIEVISDIRLRDILNGENVVIQRP